MAKMVDARDLKSLGASRPGSIPGERTIRWVIVFIMANTVGFLILGCDRPLTQEEKWVRDQDKRCISARSRGSYNRETKTYECWNRPYFRRPKITFIEKYQ